MGLLGEGGEVNGGDVSQRVSSLLFKLSSADVTYSVVTIINNTVLYT